ncbi:hypothetical protein M8494_14845 [Serratia ureilytica]
MSRREAIAQAIEANHYIEQITLLFCSWRKSRAATNTR